MTRSTVVSITKRRKSLRVRKIEPEVFPSIESVVKTRRNSANHSKGSSSTNQSSKKSSSEDVSYRRNRQKSAHSREEDLKPETCPSSKYVANKLLHSKKRSSASMTPIQKSKRQKTHERFSLARKPAVKAVPPPMTRRQRQLLSNQVTPSPASEKESTGSLAFDFSSPFSNRRKSTSALPRGVIDLYPIKLPSQKLQCKCAEEHCSSHALSASFVHSYGEDYWNYLKSIDQAAVVPPCSMSSSSKSSTLTSPRSSCTSSAFSHETPDHKRSWVYIDTSCVEATQPKESTKFLYYQPELTPKMRSILVDWIIELSEHFHFGPAALHLAITLVDKVLACGPLSMDDDDWGDDHDYDDTESKTNCFLISRERFQLLGAACTWLACKMEELSPPNVGDIAYVSDNIYTGDQIKRMERRICTALKFALIHPTPYPYIFEFIRASEECPNPYCRSTSTSVFQTLVHYLLELGRLPYGPVTKKPSLLAASAVYLARVTLDVRSNDTSLDPVGRWTRTLKHYTGYDKADLEETVIAIHSYQLGAEESSLKSVYAKYKSKKYGRVALKTVPLAENLGF